MTSMVFRFLGFSGTHSKYLSFSNGTQLLSNAIPQASTPEWMDCTTAVVRFDRAKTFISKCAEANKKLVPAGKRS